MDTRIRIIADAITKDAENSLKRLADLEKDLQDETIKAGDATKKQETHLNSLNDTASKSNNTFSNLGKTMLALFAVDKLIDYSKQLITLMGDTDKYRIALQNVSASQKEYEKSIAFLSKLSSDYGQNVNLLTQSYTSFIASSKSSNLSLESRQKIYESIIKAGSSLKLSNESIEGSLRAVSQMFSKGNVSAEELRGQLGERLPGAFGIMAKSMGVSEKQLNKMLEQGEVLAKDVLPKFAEELEKMYGDKAQSNLKTIDGAWNVFVTNFIEGLQDFNKSSSFIETISGWILSAANAFKAFIFFIKEAFTIGNQYNTVLNTMYDYFEIVYDAISKIVIAGWDLIKSLGQIVANIVGAGDATLTFRKVVDYMITGIKIMGSVLIGAVTVIQALADGFNIALNYGMKLANFFGKDFKIDPKATFSNLAQNAETNFKRITDLWGNSSKAIIGTAKTTNKAIVDDSDKTTKELEKDLNKQVDNNKKTNDKKSKEEKEFNKQMAAEKAAFQQKISEIDNRGEEERAFEREKAMNKIFSIYSGTYDKINKVQKIAQQSSKEIGENQTKTLTERVNKETEILKDKTNEKVKFFESIYKSHGQFLNDWYTNMNDMERQAFDYSLGMMRDMLANMNYELDQQLEGSTTNLEKAIINNKKAWIGVADSAIGSVEQLAQGNFVGAIVGGVTTVFKAIDTAADRTYELEIARIEDLRIAAEKFGQELLDASSKIINTEDINEFKNLYGSVFSEVVATWKSEDVASIFGFQQAIDNEKQVAESINRNFEVAKTREEELYQQKIKSINDAYNLDIEKINAKYDLLATKNSQRFDAESLAIQKGVNDDLMGFVTNQDLKLGLLSQYNGKRAEIESRFALSYTPIVEGMTQAEIDGINASIKARDEALAQLELWQTTQIQFVIDNGKLERDTFTETQKIIAKGKDDQYLLSLEYKQKEIDLNTQKGIELDASEKTRKENELTALNEHKAEMVKIEADYYVLIGNSFNLMKSLVLGGYDEILKKAQEALDAGKITALEFNNLVNDITFKMTNLKNTFGPGNWNLPDIVPNIIPEIEPIRIPGFKTGTEMVGGIKGVDKNLAWLSNDEAVLQGDLNKKRLDAGINRFQMVEYAINYKSILDGGFQALQIKTSALDKLEEHKAMQYLMNLNMNGVIDKLDRVESALKSIPIQNFTLDENGLSKYVETKNNVTKFKAKRLK